MRPDQDQDKSIEEVLARLPATLFKFSGLSNQRLEWMRRIIVESELYFPAPSSFNDPLDCRVTPLLEASVLTAELHWRNAWKKLHPEVSSREIKKMAKRIARQIKTPEGRAGLASIITEAVARNGTVCLATDPTNVLLWSYYAEGHSGIAVRFSTVVSPLLKFGDLLKHQGTSFLPIEVQYSAEFPEVNFFKSSTHDILNVILGTKAIAWKHEAEWRFVLPGRTGYFKIPPTTIDGIAFGMRTDQDAEGTVRQWVVERGGGIELLRVTNKPGSFELRLVPA